MATHYRGASVCVGWMRGTLVCNDNSLSPYKWVSLHYVSWGRWGHRQDGITSMGTWLLTYSFPSYAIVTTTLGIYRFIRAPRMTITNGAKQPIDSYLGGRDAVIQQGTNV